MPVLGAESWGCAMLGHTRQGRTKLGHVGLGNAEWGCTKLGHVGLVHTEWRRAQGWCAQVGTGARGAEAHRAGAHQAGTHGADAHQVGVRQAGACGAGACRVEVHGAGVHRVGACELRAWEAAVVEHCGVHGDEGGGTDNKVGHHGSYVSGACCVATTGACLVTL